MLSELINESRDAHRTVVIGKQDRSRLSLAFQLAIEHRSKYNSNSIVVCSRERLQSSFPCGVSYSHNNNAKRLDPSELAHIHLHYASGLQELLTVFAALHAWKPAPIGVSGGAAAGSSSGARPVGAAATPSSSGRADSSSTAVNKPSMQSQPNTPPFIIIDELSVLLDPSGLMQNSDPVGFQNVCITALAFIRDAVGNLDRGARREGQGAVSLLITDSCDKPVYLSIIHSSRVVLNQLWLMPAAKKSRDVQQGHDENEGGMGTDDIELRLVTCKEASEGATKHQGLIGISAVRSMRPVGVLTPCSFTSQQQTSVTGIPPESDRYFELKML